MLWNEVKRWSKDKGYTVVKDEEDNQYYWKKNSSNDIKDGGVASSVSKLARAIYNHLTENKWVEHQKTYQENLELKKASISDY